jgi:hypothetical protein
LEGAGVDPKALHQSPAMCDEAREGVLGGGRGRGRGREGERERRKKARYETK